MNVVEIFLTMINRSITAGIVVLAVLPVRALLGRLNVPRRYIYLLWLIPALRLLCPVTISSGASLFNLPVFDRAVQTKEGLAYLPQELTGVPQTEESENLGPGAYGMGAVQRDIGEQANYYGGQVFELSSRPVERESETGSLPEEISRSVDWRSAILHSMAGIWLAGAAAIALRQLCAYGKIRREVACAVRLEGQDNVFICENIGTPFAMGVLRSRIYIPCHMEERELPYVLLHEQYHIRRHDLWVRLLACALQAIHWYNPLIWAAVRCMERDMEMRCDEYVLGRLGENIRYDYSLSLLSCAVGRGRRPMDVTTFGESGTGRRVSHVLKYKKTGICIAVLAVLVILVIAAVCLTDRKPREEELPEKTVSVEKTYFWGQQELQMQLAQSEVPAMSLVGRSTVALPLTAKTGDYGDSIHCVGESCFFLVRPFYGEDSVTYEMQMFDGDSKEWSQGFLEMELLKQNYLYGMFAVSDEELVYLVPVKGSGWQYEAYYAVHVNRAGEELKRVDLLPACLELDMIQEQVLPTNICVDNQGNYYMISFDGKQMAILDKEGASLDSRDCSVRYKRVIPWMTAGPDGGILTQGYHETEGMEWLWLEGVSERHLGGVKGGGFGDRMIPLDNGVYYYITGEKKIYQGDAQTGDTEFLFDAGSIIGVWGEVAVNGDGEVLLFVQKEDCAVVYVLSRAGETRMGEGGENIAAADPLYAIDITGFKTMGLEATLPRFMADHPEYAFDLQIVSWEERGAAHDRVWNELIAGGGPDIFYIYGEDLPALWEKGVLMDIGELVSQETLDQIYPGLLDTGIIDGSLAGVSDSYVVDSMVTSADLWPEEEWTLEDVVDMLERGKFPHALSYMGSRYCGGSLLVSKLVREDIANSPFIDWERGVCSFDSELFIRLLKVAKRYDYDLGAEVEELESDYLAAYSQLLEGKCLAVVGSLSDRDYYVSIRQRMGESYNRPGIPGAAGSRQVPRASGYYVVNKNCGNKQAAAAYLEYVLSVDNIGDYRRDCRDTFAVLKDWEGKWAVSERMSFGSGLRYLLDQSDPAIYAGEMPEIYADYLRYSEDYYDYMESLEGSPPTDDYIWKIMDEELDNYFLSGQSAEHVAEVIQKRVQLYLNERQ